MNGIFISFRKDDSRLLRLRIDEALTRRFGRMHVFKSGESIAIGTPFPAALVEEARNRELMLALIGPAWLGEDAAPDGGRRIDAEHDWVRREIAEGLRHGNRVVPVLLGDGTALPNTEQLPTEIQQLATLQFLRVTDTRAEADLTELIDRLIWILPPLGRLTPQPAEAGGPGAGPDRPASMATAESVQPLVIRRQVAERAGVNLDNSSGTIQTTGGGSISIGGDHSNRSTTINQTTGMAPVAAPLVQTAAQLADARRAGQPTVPFGTDERSPGAITSLLRWTARHWGISTVAGIGTALAVAITVATLTAPKSDAALAPPASPETPAAALTSAAAAVPTTTASPVAIPQAAAASGIPAAGTDTFSVQDTNQDTWTMTIAFGAPVPGGSASVQQIVDAASSCIPGTQYQPDQMLVVPVQSTYELTSAKPLNNFTTTATATSLNVFPAEVFQYSADQYGCSSTMGEPAGQDFPVLNPHQARTANSWILVTGAYNGQGRLNISQIAGLYLTSAGLDGTVLSQSGPDLCKTNSDVIGMYVTGLRGTNQGCTPLGAEASAS